MIPPTTADLIPPEPHVDSFAPDPPADVSTSATVPPALIPPIPAASTDPVPEDDPPPFIF